MASATLRRLQVHVGPTFFASGRSVTLSVDWGDLAASLAPGSLADFLAGLAAHPALARATPPSVAPSAALAVWSGRHPDLAVRWLAVALQRAIGHPLPAERDRDAELPPPGRVAVPIWDVELGVMACRTALALVAAAPATSAILDEYFAAAGAINYSESDIRTIMAAERRGIPWDRLTPGTDILRLGHGTRQKRLLHAFTPATSHIATQLATHKHIAARLLRRQGLPVPGNRRVGSIEAAIDAAAALGFPVVVKPNSTDYGTAVSLDIRSEADLRRAYAEAARHGAVLVEQQIAGDHTRLLVMHGRFISAVRQDPAQVFGDGRRTVAALIAAVNVERTAELSSSFKKIAIDDEARLLLDRQGLTLDSIPAEGCRVRLRHTSNTSRGGTARNVTALVHPDNARLAERAAAIVGLDNAGVDLITPDIERSFRDVGGAICEINPTPGLYMREAGLLVEDALLDGLFAAGDRGRVPVICLLAEDDDGAAALMSEIAAPLDRGHGGVALVQPRGLRIGDWRVSDRPLPLHEATGIVLADPDTRVAVIHLTPRAVSEDGLGFDSCDLAMVAHSPAGEAAGAAALLSACAAKTIDLSDRSHLLQCVERVAEG